MQNIYQGNNIKFRKDENKIRLRNKMKITRNGNKLWYLIEHKMHLPLEYLSETRLSSSRSLFTVTY